MRSPAIAISLAILAIPLLVSCMNKGFTETTGLDKVLKPPATSQAPAPTPPANSSGAVNGAAPLQLVEKVNNEGGVSVQVVPEAISPGRPLVFRVTLDAHSGSLNFRLAEAALVRDGRGNEYRPQEWRGDPPGGHHVSGTLVFPVLKEQPQSLTLVLADIGGVKERKFTWS